LALFSPLVNSGACRSDVCRSGVCCSGACRRFLPALYVDAACRQSMPPPLLSVWKPFVQDRQLHVKGGSLPWPAGDFDTAAVLGNQTIDY